jgi:hypothetical protein
MRFFSILVLLSIIACTYARMRGPEIGSDEWRDILFDGDEGDAFYDIVMDEHYKACALIEHNVEKRGFFTDRNLRQRVIFIVTLSFLKRNVKVVMKAIQCSSTVRD